MSKFCVAPTSCNPFNGMVLLRPFNIKYYCESHFFFFEVNHLLQDDISVHDAFLFARLIVGVNMLCLTNVFSADVTFKNVFWTRVIPKIGKDYIVQGQDMQIDQKCLKNKTQNNIKFCYSMIRK